MGIWMTPVMWTGYILLADNIVYKRQNYSLLSLSGRLLPAILLISISSWLIFEGYNLLLKNWYYVNLPENRAIRFLGYAWSFSTITPGILVTKDALVSFGMFKHKRCSQLRISNRSLSAIIGTSLLLSIYPLVFPNKYLFPLIWCSVIFLVDPIVYLLKGRSILGELIEGKPGTLLQLLLAGLVCGLLWEFWNYWAIAKWIYTVPYFPQFKLFEMPVIGFLGFPPFAVECYVLYQLFKKLLHIIGVKLKYS